MIIEIKDSQEKQVVTEEVLRDLPEWFGIEEAINKYIHGVKDKVFFAAFDKDNPIGFYCIRKENDQVLDMYVLGIKRSHHRLGIGKALQSHVEDYAKSKGYHYLMVLTLAKKAYDEAYLKTRKFYLDMGFIDFYQNDEIFDKDNPCQIMMKKL
jgi:GNAT superfamily N-acetyltransferase